MIIINVVILYLDISSESGGRGESNYSGESGHSGESDDSVESGEYGYSSWVSFV